MIKGLIKTIKAQIKISERMFYFPEIVRIGHTNVIVDQDVLDARGFRFAAAIPTTEGMKIIVDQEFLTLPLASQEVIIAHEKGHITKNHQFSYISAIRRVLPFGVCPMEREADAYAAEQLGKEQVIATLQDLYSRTGFSEIKRRIKVLQA